MLHAVIRIDDTVFMAAEPSPQSGWPTTQLGLMLYTPDVDAAFDRAVQAGATPKEKPAEMVSLLCTSLERGGRGVRGEYTAVRWC